LLSVLLLNWSMALPPLALWIRCIVSFFTSTSWPYAQLDVWISLPELDVDYEMVTVNNYKTSHKTLLSLVRWLANKFLMVLSCQGTSLIACKCSTKIMYSCAKSLIVSQYCILPPKKHHVLQPYAFPWRCCHALAMNNLFTPEFWACSWLPFPTFPSYWEPTRKSWLEAAIQMFKEEWVVTEAFLTLQFMSSSFPILSRLV
jgi:hypothetical protein